MYGMWIVVYGIGKGLLIVAEGWVDCCVWNVDCCVWNRVGTVDCS